MSLAILSSGSNCVGYLVVLWTSQLSTSPRYLRYSACSAIRRYLVARSPTIIRPQGRDSDVRIFVAVQPPLRLCEVGGSVWATQFHFGQQSCQCHVPSRPMWRVRAYGGKSSATFPLPDVNTSLIASRYMKTMLQVRVSFLLVVPSPLAKPKPQALLAKGQRYTLPSR